jgi:hypothetical protein
MSASLLKSKMPELSIIDPFPLLRLPEPLITTLPSLSRVRPLVSVLPEVPESVRVTGSQQQAAEIFVVPEPLIVPPVHSKVPTGDTVRLPAPLKVPRRG